MVSVSLCMIVKDEEAVLSRCLTSVGDFADEIIIVDTGSKDRTKEIAGRFTDKIYDFAWRDDFTAARNFAFGKGTGDYLFWMDADDVIPREELTKLMDLKASLEEPLPDVVMMNYAVGFDESGRPVFSFFRERMIKRGPNAVWQGRIHEVIPPFGTVIKKEITIEHHKRKTSDAGRNLRILKEMQRTEGLGTRDQYYYGKELYYHKQYREAERALAEFLKRPDGWREDQVDACRHRAYCLYGLSEEEEALSALLEGLRFSIPRPELCCDIGWWFFRRERYPEAAWWYRRALENRKTAGNEGFIQEELRGYVPCLQLCVCYDRMGKRGLAARYNEMADRFRPGSEVCEQNRRYFRKTGAKPDVPHMIK